MQDMRIKNKLLTGGRGFYGIQGVQHTDRGQANFWKRLAERKISLMFVPHP